MTSTLLGYQLYAKNLPQSLKRVAAEPENKNDQAYFDANIGKVKTVDDFLKNYRLFSYAMKAYGLQDLTYAKGLIKKVLTSDLNDAGSVANKLSDSRYKALAQAFNFSTTGAVVKTSIQNAAQQAATVTQFKANEIGLDGNTVESATTYYTSHIGSVTSLADLQKDAKLYAYVTTAFGIDPGTSKAALASVVGGSLSNPNSGLNTKPGAGYFALHEGFNVDATGVATAGSLMAQTSDQTTATIQAYANSVGSDKVSQDAAKGETAYFGSLIGTLKIADDAVGDPRLKKTVDDLVGDPRLVDFVVKAFNLPSSTTASVLKGILTSDPSTVGDPDYKAAAEAFNFAADGSLRAVQQIQTAGQRQSTVALYTARLSSDTDEADAATRYYQANIGSVKTVAALEKDTQLYDYVLKAYGIDPGTPKATVEKVLKQPATATYSLVAKTEGSHDLALHMAFSVDPDGTATDALQVQTASALNATTSAYMSAAGPDKAAQAAAKTETSYYKAAIAKGTTVGALVADSRLVAYVEKAFNLPKSTTAAQLRQVLTSDVDSPLSSANKLGGAFLQVAQAFTFNAAGLPTHQLVQTAENTAQIRATDQTFLRQAMEDEAGEQNQGVKLALYFARKGPALTNAYQILADKALTQVFQTYLGLPSSTSNTSLDKQAAYIKRKVNFADFRDPAKLAKMVRSFAARYDVANPDAAQSDTVKSLFGTGDAAG